MKKYLVILGLFITLLSSGQETLLQRYNIGELNLDTIAADINKTHWEAFINRVAGSGNHVDVGDAIQLTGDVTGSTVFGETSTSISTNIATGAVGSVELASTSVTAGIYKNTNLTVDADGRITAAASGNPTVQLVTPVGGTATMNVTTNKNARVLNASNNGSFTITMSGMTAGASGNLVIANGTNGGTITFAGYTNKLSPTIFVTTNVSTISGGGKLDIFSYFYDGTNLYWNGTKDYK